MFLFFCIVFWSDKTFLHSSEGTYPRRSGKYQTVWFEFYWRRKKSRLFFSDDIHCWSNEHITGSAKSSMSFEDRRVCRPFLLSCCPHEILSGTVCTIVFIRNWSLIFFYLVFLACWFGWMYENSWICITGRLRTSGSRTRFRLWNRCKLIESEEWMFDRCFCLMNRRWKCWINSWLSVIEKPKMPNENFMKLKRN